LIAAFAKGNRRRFLVVFALTDLGYGIYISNISGRFGYGYMFLWWTAVGWVLAYAVAQKRVDPDLAFSGQG
jgi:hypothetical protein